MKKEGAKAEPVYRLVDGKGRVIHTLGPVCDRHGKMVMERHPGARMVPAEGVCWYCARFGFAEGKRLH